MNLILCIETSTEVCSVALAQNGKTIGLLHIEQGNEHASKLNGLVQELLLKAGYGLNQLDAVAVCKGPGSYTGLRVGVSAAKGFCYALDIPLIAIDSLTSLAAYFVQHNNLDQNALLIPMIDARRMEVYTAVFNQKLNMLAPIEAKVIGQDSFTELLNRQELVFFGNGAEKCKANITHKNAVFVDGIHCSASGLCLLANEAFINNSFENVAYFEPYYLKDFVGTQARKLV
ncbi:MAG: tRNA (adenosine(37)-N6)-threonylcarbamoyltransferase complex dimerization subunit type 1 TsaB [Bacteroidota bacterium]|nr:tRNA (adenosine(37)-N6)-threonylcarbamoyltransferase complex dimerization subunit type 1 TsaB [Bacteroidota bacterium]